MSVIGFIITLVGFLSYFIMIGAFHRFTYKTWIFDSVVGVGMILGVLSWLLQGSSWLTWSTIIVGLLWFLITRNELRIPGSKELNLRVGDRVPPMTFVTTDGAHITEQDLIADAPVLLSLYRGWWCPSSKLQLDELMQHHEYLSKMGVKVYAASVDGPDEAKPLQEHFGDKITILCNVPEDVLDEIGVKDQRGAPWYDRLTSGTPEQPIAMPAALVIDKNGKIVFASRSTQVDDRPRADEILASLSRNA